MCMRTGLLIITLLLPIFGEAQQQPDANINLALSVDATLSGSVPVGTGRGTPLDILYDPSIGDYASVTQFNEYGVAVSEDLGIPTVGNGLNWQVTWTTAKQINYLTFGGTYPNQPQPNTNWRISYRNNAVWTIIEEGTGGWIDSGIYVWDITDQQPITADAIKVELYSDGINNLVSIHLRGRGGDSTYGDDSATLPKATLIQLLPYSNNNQNCACWETNGSNDIFYDTSNVGIGTNAPTEDLDVVGTIKSEKLVVDLPTDGIVAQFGDPIPANPGRRNFDFVSYQSSSSPFLEFTMFDNNYNGRFSIMTRADDEFMILKDNQGSEVFKVARDPSLGSYIHLPKSDSRVVIGGFGGYLVSDGHKLVVKDGSALVEGNILTNNKIGVGVSAAEIPNDYHLAVNGKIISEEVKVQLFASGWPDYVFSKDYQLLSLQDLEHFINLKGHLPNIPSAQDVDKNGVLLGDMDAKLLEKIEELTLYTIQQEKKIEAQAKKNEALIRYAKQQEEKNKELEERLTTLEQLIAKKSD